MKRSNRTNVAAYLTAKMHLGCNLRSAKTLAQMAAELGTTKTTVRRWLRHDHWDLWMEHWASAEELWQAAQENRLADNPAQRRPTFEIILEPFCQSEADEANSRPAKRGRRAFF
jgi:hypothetical protein